MAKQLNVNLAFTADTSKAKAQLQDLQNQLSKITSSNFGSGLAVSKDIEQATSAAARLQQVLTSATNVNTGKLDLSKFNQSLQKSGKSLKDYRNDLIQLGPEGQRAFVALTDSIYNADLVVKRSNQHLTQLKNTLVNTARWQLSSSILHGFMGAVQSAYGYAQDLNESLNNIRIVTGYNTDQMSKFADEANRAAKALSTTTTSYTNASLIYYQQGLSDQEVKERTDITIKMANVARESAETVSDQMTAVWNNFYDGSKSLEYYADVMTALGAATASSTSEISEGLEKFAAVAETVGLSYEYATAALATVTATTRQSADVVGTAFKTLFARIQDLELGETLDDGTTLGKYSEALNAVGINILDASGNLMEMDDILDAMAGKWDTLTKAQQTSLAQTVAGTRQYTQLVALMENWDSMQQNLGVVADSSGALQEQQDIYAEGWEAANQRVTASLQRIYKELISDKGFITILNFFSDFIDTIGNVIDSLGGLHGVLATLGTLMFKIFSKDLAKGINNFGLGFSRLMGKDVDQNIALKKQAASLTTFMGGEATTLEGDVAGTVYEKRATLQAKMIENADRISEEEREYLQLLLDGNKALGERVIKKAKEADETKENADAQITNAIRNNTFTNSRNIKRAANYAYEEGKISGVVDYTSNTLKNTDNLSKGTNINALRKVINEPVISDRMKQNPAYDQLIQKLEQARQIINELQTDEKGFLEDDCQDADRLKNLLSGINTEMSRINTVDDLIDSAGGDADGRRMARQAINQQRKAGSDMIFASGMIEDFEAKTEETGEQIDNTASKIPTMGDKISAVSQTVMAATMAFNALSGVISTLNDEDMGYWEKLIAVLSTVGMTLPMIISSVSALGPAFGIAGKGAAAAGAAAAAGGKAASVAWGPIIGIIAGVVGACALLVGVFHAIQQNSPEAKMKRLTEATEQATEAANNLKTALNNTVNTLNELNSVDDKFKNLKRGTLEWTQAVIENNEAVLDLLKSYNLFKEGYYDKDADGIYRLTYKAEEEIKEKANLNYNRGFQNQLNAQAQLVYESRFANKEFQKIFSGNSSLFDDFMTEYISEETGRTTQDKRQGAFNEYKEIIEKGIREGKITNDKEDILAYVKKSENYISNAGNWENEDGLRALEKALTENQKSIDQLFLSIKENTEQYKLYGKEIVKGQFGEEIDSYNLDPRIKELYSETLGAELVATITDNFDKYFKEDAKDAFNLGTITIEGVTLSAVDGEGFRDEDIQKAYAAIMGYDINNFVNNDKNTADYYDYSGNLVGDDIKDEVARQAVARYYTLENTGAENLENFKKNFEILKDLADGNENLLTGYMSFMGGEIGDLTALTENELNKLDLTQISKAYEAAGYESADAFFEALTKAQNSAISTLGSVWSGQLFDLPEGAFSNLTIQAQDSISQALEKAFSTGGKEGLKTLTNLFTQAGDNAGVLADIINSGNIDWTSVDALEQLKQALEDQGVELNYTDEEWNTLITTLKEANINVHTLVNAFDTLRETVASLSKAIKDLKFGDIIDDEAYAEIIKLNKEYQKFFTMTADGWKFIGSEGDLEGVLGAALGDLDEYKQKFETVSQDMQEVSTFDWAQANKENTSMASMALGKLSDETFKAAGTSKDEIEAAIDNFNSKDSAKQAEARSVIEDFYTQMENLQTQYENGVFESIHAEELWINTTVDSLERLGDEYERGAISAEAYANTMESVFQSEVLKEGFDYEEVKAYADALEQLPFVTTREEANKLALANKKLNQGFQTIIDSWDDWEEKLKSEDLSDPAYLAALNEIKDATTDMLNVDEVDTKFITQHMDKIKAAAQGDTDAIVNLRREHAIALAEATGAEQAEIDNLKGAINSFNMDFAIGTSLDEAKLTKTFQDLLNAGAITAQQLEDILSSIGFEPEITWIPMKYSDAQKVTKQSYILGEDGEYTALTSDTDIENNATVYVPTINGSKTSYSGSPKATAKSTAAGGSGNTSPAKKVDRTKKTDVVERYKEVEDSIDDLNDTLEDINKQADRLYGASRLAQMKKANALVEDEIDLLKEKKRQAQDYLKQDFDALGQAAANAGVVFELDEKGNITNYTEQMSALYEELAAAEHYMDTAFSTSEDQDEYQESTVQPIQDKIDELTDAISQYEETRELLEDLDDEIDDKFYEWQDANYEMLTYEIEFKLEINDLELKRIDYYLSKYNDDVYTQAEAVFELSKKKNFYLEQLEIENYRYEELQRKYEAGEISQADYADGLKTTAENTWEAAEQLREYDNEMMEFYSNTLAKVNEEVTKYTDNMDAAASALEHYKNIAKLAGREQDYSLMGAMLEGSVKMKANDLAVSKQMYQNATSEVERIKGELAAATSKEQRELLQKELDAAEAQANEWQDKMLTDVEEYLTAQKELYDNNIEALNASFEKLATGGDGFDVLKNKMSSLSEHAEEFLTDTNKIYETEKMIRNIDKEIGSTSNTMAQQKLKAFRQQTQELQNQEELSQFELDIQQAKYDLLLAEIALEESRNSKTTMRLARDAMGNYSYVYTADAEKVAEAEQQVSDAQNKLYNTRLDGANKYGEQLASIRQEWIEAIEGLDRNDADYYAKRDALNEYYMGKMADVSHLYAIATGEDAIIAQEAWTTSIVTQIGSVEDFEQNMKTYLSNIDAEWDTYKEKVDEVTTDVGLDLDDAETSVKDLTDKHEDLRKKLVDEVIPALQTETTEVGNVVSAYGELRQGIIDTITEYEKLGNAATDAYDKIANTPNTSGGNNENPEDNNIDLPSDTGGYVPEPSVEKEEDPIPRNYVNINETVSTTKDGEKYHSINGLWYKDADVYSDSNGFYLSDEAKGQQVVGQSMSLSGDAIRKTNDTARYITFYDKDGNVIDKRELTYDDIEKLKTRTIQGYKKFNGANLYRLNMPVAGTWWLNKTDLNQLLGIENKSNYLNFHKSYSLIDMSSMATGGYTGAWGPSGKLAVLHEKELVLNKQDTENLLKVIDIIRANKLIDAQVAQLQHDYTTALLEHELTKMSALFDEFMERQEEASKEVNIYADFPGVSSAVEIEAALRNLANDAAQYSGINWN